MVDIVSGWICVGKCGRSTNTPRFIAIFKPWFQDFGLEKLWIERIEESPQYRLLNRDEGLDIRTF